METGRVRDIDGIMRTTRAMTTMSADMDARLERIEHLLADLVAGRTHREAYGTEEFASIVGKAEFTVREWCRNGRIRAEKRACGRGRSQEWFIRHEELDRYRAHGLLPLHTPE